jgi:dTDP-4-amino-4,6-dideoxygalactose transaminase
MNKDRVSFLDLTASHRELEDRIVEVFKEILRSGRFVGGEMVEGFEIDFAKFCNVRHCIGVSSGTDALRFSLIAADVKPGETVITVPNTFIATTEAITQAGGIPDFVDVNKNDYNMEPEKLLAYLTDECYFDKKKGKLINKKTGSVISAIIPVHLYGQMADMDSILELAAKYNLLVVEDACQAHGAQYYSRKENGWKVAGSVGRAAAFSFYPGKNLGAFGEGGAVVTNDDTIAQKVRMLRDHGQAQKHFHEHEGYNGRLDSIQAGILKIKLEHLITWNGNRRLKAYKYDNLLEGLEHVRIPHENGWARSVYHLYVIRTKKREELRNYLINRGITTGVHYPIPLHLQKAYKQLGYKEGSFPIAEIAALEVLSLPMYPELNDHQQAAVADGIKEFFS